MKQNSMLNAVQLKEKVTETMQCSDLEDHSTMILTAVK